MQNPAPRILSFDTTTSACCITLCCGGQILGEINLDSATTHSVRLLPGIDYLLTHAGLPIQEIDAYAVCSGPGSFTGIRIGLATAEGLAHAHQKPLIPVSAFDAWAEKFSGHRGLLAPWIDARRHEVYAALYDLAGNPGKAIRTGTADRPETVLDTLPLSELVFVGDGARLYRALIEARQVKGWRIVESDHFLGRSISAIAWQRWQTGALPVAAKIEPVYLRKSDAELAWKEK